MLILMIEYENLSKTNAPFIKGFKKNLAQFFEKGWYILGENVTKFEEEYAKYCGTNYCVSVASGLDAMIIALETINLPKGSEILVPSNTYIATILAIVRAGYKPILVEPDIKTYNIDPDLIEKNISKNTRAILITHLYGRPCKMDRIQQIVNHFNLFLLEDCAQAHGATYLEQKVGSFGIGCHSFYPTKNLGALGDGGAITFNDEDLYEKIKAYRNYGSIKKYENKYIGLNSRLDEIQAIFLREKLKGLNRINEKKIELSIVYDSLLDERFIKPKKNSSEKHVYHIYNVRHPKRDSIKVELMKNNIASEIHYPIPPHNQNGYKNIIKGNYPISEEIHATTLSLPISYSHSKDEIAKVSEVLNSILKKYR